jgi:hypothetical protein
MQYTPSILATLATKDAINDLNILLQSVAYWSKLNEKELPVVYIFGDEHICDYLEEADLPFKIHSRSTLSRYTAFTRQEMERMTGEGSKTVWMDFMMEKISLLEWVFESEPILTEKGGVLFCDADICFFGPLPEIPAYATVALSRHMIRQADEGKYGRYNGGFLWMKHQRHLNTWREGCKISRFYEQSALEDVAADSAFDGELYEFPITQNYGWWRMFQADESVEKRKNAWTMHRFKHPKTAGILIDGEPLGSIHTHLYCTTDIVTITFNRWVHENLRRLAIMHMPAKNFLSILNAP